MAMGLYCLGSRSISSPECGDGNRAMQFAPCVHSASATSAVYVSFRNSMPTRVLKATAVLNRIVEFYLSSHDFNGIRANVLLEGSEPDPLETLKKLVSRGLVEVYSSAYDNPYIKRLPALSIPQQLGFLESANGEAHVCLFPSVKAMRRRLRSSKYRTKPFSRFLALGHAQLEPVFFQLGVLGRYQSDPRYICRFDGLDGHISVKTADYKGRGMPEADKVGLETFGLGTSAKGHASSAES
jgi:hypothetical protein